MNLNLSRILTQLSGLFVRYFRFILVIVVALWLVLGYLILISPKWEEVREAGLFDYNNEKQLKEKNETYLADLKKSLAKFDQINKEDIERLAKIIPRESGIAELFVVVEEMIKESGLSLNSISFSEGQSLSEAMERAPTAEAPSSAPGARAEAVSKNIYILDIALNISGGRDYKDLKILLETIEKSQRIMDINSISFNPPAQEAAQEISFGLNVKTYYIKE